MCRILLVYHKHFKVNRVVLSDMNSYITSFKVCFWMCRRLSISLNKTRHGPLICFINDQYTIRDEVLEHVHLVFLIQSPLNQIFHNNEGYII